MNGYTEVWSGSAVQLLSASQPWQSLVGSEKLKTEWDQDNYLSLWVANEHIDWVHYRETGKYVFCWGQTQVNPMRRMSPRFDEPNLNEELGE